MDTHDRKIVVNGKQLVCTVYRSESGSPIELLALHGAGQANGTELSYILRYLQQRGWSAIAPDFSGHGESSGPLQDSSLDARLSEARAVWSQCGSQPLNAILGSSMGGHVAATLVPLLHPALLVLFSPAAYATAAQPVAFGQNFSEIIRSRKSYRSSLAFESLTDFGGRLLIVVGDLDQVIPGEVIDRYLVAAPKARSVRLLRIRGADHRIHAWLASHAADRTEALEAVAAELHIASNRAEAGSEVHRSTRCV